MWCHRHLSKISAQTRQERDREFKPDQSCEFCKEELKVQTPSRLPSWCCIYKRTKSAEETYQSLTSPMLDIVTTMFHFHSETGNIWTHFIGLFMYFGLFYHVCHNPPVENMTMFDYGLIWLYFMGVFTCLIHSTLFHIFSCHSMRINILFAKLDYCGITVLIGCSFIPWIYYAFYNSPRLQLLYMTMTLISGIVCTVFSMFDCFSDPSFHTYRALTFSADGFTVILPAINWIIREVLYGSVPFFSLDHRAAIALLFQGTVYLIGALVYLFRIPEIFYPYDDFFFLWFNSHQIFHILVLVGALGYYHSFILIMKIRLTDKDSFYN